MGTYDYDAWGQIISVKEAEEGSDEDGILTRNPFRYRGYYYDEETGYYYLNFRYYDPSVRRFISPDDGLYKQGDSAVGYNMYAYCDNHPVGTADYDGHVAVGASIALDLLLKLLIELVISAGCTYMIYETVDSISGKQEQVPSYDEFKNQSKQNKKSKHKEKAKEDSGETTETGIEEENDNKTIKWIIENGWSLPND